MASDDVSNFLLHFEENRLATYNNWPFEDSSACAAVKMAAAGFYHCPINEALDNVRCYVCGKELNSWEIDDDPMKEHKKHSPSCMFLTLRTTGDMTLGDLLTHIEKRMINSIKEKFVSTREEFAKEASKARDQIEALAEN